MKQTRKIKSPVPVTLGLVELGEIIGILFCWQIGAASSERDEATSPRMATTLSREISLLTTVAGSPALERSSSVSNSIFLPSTPPAALICSTASNVPSCDEMPNVASLPVSEAYSPTLMVSLLAAVSDAGLLQPVRKIAAAIAAGKNCPRQIFMNYRLENSVPTINLVSGARPPRLRFGAPSRRTT